MVRLDTRGPESGICNICGLHARLTDDHIPPKGVPLVGQAYLEKLTSSLGAEKNRSGGRLFQRGVKYRSICSKCNNELLGASYDPTLVQFCKELHSILIRQVHLPATVSVQVNKLLRAFVGHIVSHGLGQHRIGDLSSLMTDYLVDSSIEFPSSLRAYAWVYPYKRQVVAHGVGSIFDFRHHQDAFVFSLLKFYPVGFMCATADLPPHQEHLVTRLDQLTSGTIDARANVTFNLSSIPGGRWPEAPGKNGTVLHNDTGTVARPVQT